jgi:hypothetical protein
VPPDGTAWRAITFLQVTQQQIGLKSAEILLK